MAEGDSAIHRLDPRAKVVATMAFILSVVSWGRYELTPLFPFFLFPVAMVARGNLPVGPIVRKVALVLPFAFLVGIFNPLFDREVLVRLGPLAVTGGWVSCGSIILRAVLTVGAAVILMATTGFPAICGALERLGIPRPFVVQLLSLYRYIFVLGEEGSRTVRARELRSCGKRGMEMRTYASLVGHLLLRTWERAERIHRAMLCRGFAGRFPVQRTYRFRTGDLLFVLGWTSLFLLFRLVNIPEFLGAAVAGLVR